MLRGKAGDQPEREKCSGSDGQDPCVAHGWLPEGRRQADNEKHVDGPGEVSIEKVKSPSILREGPQHRYLPVRADIEDDVEKPSRQGEKVAVTPGGKSQGDERKGQRDQDQADERVGIDLMVRCPRLGSQEGERRVGIRRDGGDCAEHGERNPVFACGAEGSSQQTAGRQMRECVQSSPQRRLTQWALSCRAC